MNINHVLIFGNLTRDPELRALPSGMNVVNFSIATNRTFKDRDGKRQEQTDFHSIVAFGKQADSIAQYLKKGASAFVEGRLQTRSWDKDGVKHFRTEVVADRVQFGPKLGTERTPSEPRTTDTEDTAGSSGIEYPVQEVNPDDIPF
jgi:single-strand DNA-binding protein